MCYSSAQNEQKLHCGEANEFELERGSIEIALEPERERKCMEGWFVENSSIKLISLIVSARSYFAEEPFSFI